MKIWTVEQLRKVPNHPNNTERVLCREYLKNPRRGETQQKALYNHHLELLFL